jgi:DNA-binding beta-propeller fold protein YncE
MQGVTKMVDAACGRKWILSAALVAVLFSWTVHGRGVEADHGPYRIITSIPGGSAEGIWDYATVDDAARRLYLAQDGVTVLNLDTGKVIPQFVTGRPFHGLVPVHHVLPLNGGKAVAVTVVSTNSVDFFDPQTGEIFADVTVGPASEHNWHNPDGLVYEPKSTLLVAVNGDSGSLSLIDTTAHVKSGEILIGKGKLETAIADGSGLIYVNEEQTHRVAVVDVPKRKLVQEIDLNACEEPTGLAYDADDHLVISVCSNGLAKFISTDTRQEMASVSVGTGADGIIYDAKRHIVFSFGGDNGTVSVIAVHGPKEISLVQTLKTGLGARLGALDPMTGRVYIPVAKFGPPAAPIKMPGMEAIPGLNPHTFKFLVVGPTSP